MRGQRCWKTGLLLGGALLLCGCYQTPQQRLIGRWFNAEMSLRFQSDGIVVFNSSEGLTRGRYEFVPTPAALGAQSGQENLVIDLSRNGRRTRLYFEAVFLAHDRLRLHDHTPRATGLPSESLPQFALLRRAGDTPTRASLIR